MVLDKMLQKMKRKMRYKEWNSFPLLLDWDVTYLWCVGWPALLLLNCFKSLQTCDHWGCFESLQPGAGYQECTGVAPYTGGSTLSLWPCGVRGEQGAGAVWSLMCQVEECPHSPPCQIDDTLMGNLAMLNWYLTTPKDPIRPGEEWGLPFHRPW